MVLGKTLIQWMHLRSPMFKLMRMAEEIAEDNLAEFNNLQAELDHAFAQLSHNVAQETAADES